MRKWILWLLILFMPCLALAEASPIIVSVGLSSNGQAAGIGKRAPWGIHKADLIYETMLYQPGQTRLACVFQSNLPNAVGPVRSARMSHFYLREEYGAALVFCGDAGIRARDHMQPDLALSSPLILNFHHSPLMRTHCTRIKGIKAPDNLSADLAALQRELLFSASNDWLLPSGELHRSGTPVREVLLHWGNVQWQTRLIYDEERNLWQMYRADAPFLSRTEAAPGSTSVPIHFSTVIIQHVDVDWLTTVVPVCTGLGSGRADYLIDGKWIEGSWRRSSPSSPTLWLDGEGNAMGFPQGKGYIAQFPKAYTEEFDSLQRTLTYTYRGGE